MKRKLEDPLPPAKKRKIDNNDSIGIQRQLQEASDPWVIQPKLKVASVQNGVVQISFLNIDSFYEQEIATHNIYQFELLYRMKDKHNNNNDKEWKSVKYLNHEISCYEYFYLKVLVDIKDYELQFKLRSRLKDDCNNKCNHYCWSSFSDTICIEIKSSLIAHQFKVGDFVEFRDKNEYYSREGKIVQILNDSHVRIRPFPDHFANNNEEKDNGDQDSNDDDDGDNATWRQYADLDYFLPLHGVLTDDDHDDHDESGENKMDIETDEDEDDDILMNVLETISDDFYANDDDDGNGHNHNNNERLNSFRRYLSRNRKRKRCYDIDVHTSRIYGDGIRLPSVIDITDNQLNVDKMILLRTDNTNIIQIYQALNDVLYKDYVTKYVSNDGTNRYYHGNNYLYDDNKYQLKYISSFIGKHVCDYLMNETEDRFKWKISCLRDSSDGKMRLNSVRKDIISARIDGLKDNIDKMKLYDIDNIIAFCDLCRLEISTYSFRFNCDQHITDKHDFCINCAYNVINQYLQLNQLLYPLLKDELNDDCIQEIANFVAGSVVKL